MQVWNVLHVARWKYRTQKWRKKSPSGHHPTTLSVYVFATKACTDNRTKLVKQQYLLHTWPQYGELRPTSGWDHFGSLGHPSYFQRLPRLGSVTARHVVVGVSQTLRRWTEGATCSAGRPSRWALAHILVVVFLLLLFMFMDVLCFVLCDKWRYMLYHSKPSALWMLFVGYIPCRYSQPRPGRVSNHFGLAIWDMIDVLPVFYLMPSLHVVSAPLC